MTKGAGCLAGDLHNSGCLLEGWGGSSVPVAAVSCIAFAFFRGGSCIAWLNQPILEMGRMPHRGGFAVACI